MYGNPRNKRFFFLLLISVALGSEAAVLRLQAADALLTWDPDAAHAAYAYGDAGGLVDLAVEAKSDLQLTLNPARDTVLGASGDAACFSCRLDPATGAVVLQADQPLRIALRTLAGPAAPGRLMAEAREDQQVLLTRVGQPPLPGVHSLFFPMRDLALQVESPDRFSWRWDADGAGRAAFSLKAGEALRLCARPGYYREALAIPYYAPRRDPALRSHAPAVALTWYGVKGWEGRPAQRRAWLDPQIACVAEKLLPWAGELIFQIDDNYPYDDDAYMRALSDSIRAHGLTPGIWFTPYGVMAAAEAAKHPAYFLHGVDGAPLGAFAGVNWANPAAPGPDNVILNTGCAEALQGPFSAFWRRVSETWNYDFFKIDGLPTVANRYRASVDGGGIAGFRQGLAQARELVGDQKFINGCYGIPLEAMGFVDGARTGPDAGSWTHANEVILKWNFLNNFAWWCDPDAAADQYQAPLHLTRFNTLARVLTGQQFVTDDVWTEVSEAAFGVWRQALPTLPVFPVNLYPIQRNWVQYDLFDLRIQPPAGPAWDVVGLFNYYDKPKARVLDLGRLRLATPEVHVYGLWDDRYYGLLSAKAELPAPLEGHTAAAFSLHPPQPHPVLVASSRHLGQGAMEIESATWSQEGDAWELILKTRRLVAGDVYRVTFISTRHQLTEAVCAGEKVHIENTPPVLRFQSPLSRSGAFTWRLRFEAL